MSAVAAVMSAAASSCSSAMYLQHSTRHFTPAVVIPDIAPNPLNPIPIFRPLVAVCRLPPPATSAPPPLLSSARTTSSLVSVTTPAASYKSATTYWDDIDDDDDDDVVWQDDDDEWKDDEERWKNNRPVIQALKRKNEAGRLYVGNLPYTMNPGELEEVFRQAGAVRSVEVVYDRVTDRSRGFAFITMAGMEEARKAIQLFDGAQLGGRTVKVNFPEVPRGGEREVMGPVMRGSGATRYVRFVENPYIVYAGNLGWSVTSEKLRRAMERFPGFLSARVIYERDTGRSRGYGFVSFESQEGAQQAIDTMNGVELEGRQLRLRPGMGKTPPEARISHPSPPGRSFTVGVWPENGKFV